MSILVLVLLGSVVALSLVAVFVTFLVRSAGKSRRRLEDELATSGERILRGPERANYSGGAPGDSIARATGTIVLTERRLMFSRIVGGTIEIPLNAIEAIREQARFRGHGGNSHIVVCSRGAEIGFVVSDHAGWMTALRSTLTLPR